MAQCISGNWGKTPTDLRLTVDDIALCIEVMGAGAFKPFQCTRIEEFDQGYESGTEKVKKS